MTSWAIVVGINQYPAYSGQQPLAGAVADACDFADWALDPAGGDVAPDRLFFWTHPWPAAPAGRLQAFLAGRQAHWHNEDLDWAPPDVTRQPKASEIVKTIERTGRAAWNHAIDTGEEETRRVYVFLAGHGLRATIYGGLSEETCFVARDFRPDVGNIAPGLVPCESLRRALFNNRFDEVLMFLDCCRLETTRLAMKAQPISDDSGDPVGRPFGIAFAAQDGEPAFETVSAPIRGAFTKTLMSGLRSCRDDSDALLVEGLRQYVYDNIGDNTAQKQLPNFLYKPDPSGPVIVSGPSSAGPPQFPNGPQVHTDRLPAGSRLILQDGDNRPVPGVAPLLAQAAPIQLPPLAPGLYQLEIEADPPRHFLFKQPSPSPIHVV